MRPKSPWISNLLSASLFSGSPEHRKSGGAKSCQRSQQCIVWQSSPGAATRDHQKNNWKSKNKIPQAWPSR